MNTKADAVEILPGGDWMSAKWRPMMGWVYMAICLCDFIIFPIAWSLLQVHFQGNVNDQWDPITLQGAGLIHMAFGAILGITAWSRGQEKITAMNQGYETTGPRYAPRENYNQGNYDRPYKEDYDRPKPPPVVPPKVPVRGPYTD
jgi:hypothetical protein